LADEVLKPIILVRYAAHAERNTGNDRALLHFAQPAILVLGPQIQVILDAKRRYEQKEQY
jgi:hypothetical protein